MEENNEINNTNAFDTHTEEVESWSFENYTIIWTHQQMPGFPCLIKHLKDGGDTILPISIIYDPLDCPNGIREKIKKVKSQDNKTIFLMNGESYELEEFVKTLCDNPKSKEWFRYALEALNYEKDFIFRPPSLFIENNHLQFPASDKLYPNHDNQLQKSIVDNLNIGEVDKKIIDEGIKLLIPYQKQYATYFIIPAMTVINALGIKDFHYMLDLVGTRDTGKSFAITLALHHWFGISSEMIISGDVLNSSFRHMKLSSATNLPLYIEEAELPENVQKQMKSKGMSMRGKPNLTFDTYSSLATFILSRNTRTEAKDSDEKDAIDKRKLTIFFDENDIVNSQMKSVGEQYRRKLLEQKGGKLYSILKNKTIKQITDKFYEMQTKYNDSRNLLLHFGMWLSDADVSQNNFDFGKESNDIQSAFESEVLYADSLIGQHFKETATASISTITNDDRVLRDQMEITNNTFKLTVKAFYIIARNIRLDDNPKSFANKYGYKYQPTTFKGHQYMAIYGDFQTINTSKIDNYQDPKNKY